MHTKTIIFSHTVSRHSFGPLMTTRLKSFYFLNNVVSYLLNGVAPLRHMCKAEEAEKTLVALLMVGANYLIVF
jgi:hypothetical protein